MSPHIKYQRTEAEQQAHAQYLEQIEPQELQEYEEEELKENQSGGGVPTEYIFFIDRSYSMKETIKLARKALITFLYSLPANSKFNICSYGSWHEFMFPEARSVRYDDNTMQIATQKIAEFKADFGGTEIYEPLKELFEKPKSNDIMPSHIYLLTDGAIWDTDIVIELIK